MESCCRAIYLLSMCQQLFYENMQCENKYEHYLNSTEKTVLPHGVGKTDLGQDGPSSLFSPSISRTHNCRLFLWPTMLNNISTAMYV